MTTQLTAEDKDTLLEIAKLKFPVGTLFDNSNLIPRCTGSRKSDTIPYWVGKGLYTNAGSGRFTIWLEGQWAMRTITLLTKDQSKELDNLINELN